MKKLSMTLFIPTIIFACSPTLGAQICGENVGTFISVGTEGYMCIKTTGTSGYVELDTRYDWACMTYTSDYQTSTDVSLGHHYLQNCQVKSYSCTKGAAYSSTGCNPCPLGSVASDYDGHTFTSCEYCDMGHYYNGTTCVACPVPGITTADIQYQRPITECFLEPGQYSDETGTYVIRRRPIGPDQDPRDAYCYYSE